ncbi:helix-turn-helix domain-containing protein [Brevundimonas sp. PAMC22021]|uniref:helix-turn-helix transcriptional regulator n=1 Tax=Brevundimonas sp. PAMC22021 TaxID=2861285 RepID=UPI001C63B4FB|nr:helix-turn-helix domain-containing protein [Brevundimonas sp. PAMC22021]QYF88190.1 helix-turn-helix domain-containing protein [Brevundimonas sp. PAMC22021]
MAERLAFSSEGQDPDEAFHDYRQLFSTGADVERGDGAFLAWMKGWRLSGILIFERRLSGVIHSRLQRTASDGFDHLVFTLVLSGRVVGGPESGFEAATPGEIYLADTRHPIRHAFHDAHVITASIGRDLVRAGLGDAVDQLHGVVLHPPGAGMLADYMQALVRNADALKGRALPALARSLIDLLSVVDELQSTPASEAARLEYSRREGVERFIQQRLPDRSLSVDDVINGAGISRSALYRLYEAEGGVARLIQRRRLEALRSALDLRDSSPMSLLAERLAFADERQMSRQFQRAYGVTPLAYRAQVSDTPPGEVQDARRRWKGWMTELS